MKQLRKSLIIIVLTVIALQVNAQFLSDFEAKMQGVYLDQKTNELVYLYSLNSMFYMSKPNFTYKSVKIMYVEREDTAKRKLHIKFHKSDYVRDFEFAPDFQSFVCIKPDGKKQLFRRVEKPPIKMSFSQFVNQFPLAGRNLQLLKQPITTRIIPIEVVMKFLIRDEQAPFSVFWSKMSRQDVRRELYQAAALNYHPSMYTSMFVYNYFKRLPVSNQFYTLLLDVSESIGRNTGAHYIYLVNFTRQGKLIDYVPVKYERLIWMYTSTKTTGNIVGNKIEVKEVSSYTIAHSNDARQIYTTFKYKILPDGHIQLAQKWSSNTAGLYPGVNNDHQLFIKEDKLQAEFAIYYGEKTADLEQTQALKIIQNNEAAGRFLVQAPNSKQTWSLRFSPNREQVILLKGNGVSQRFRRVKDKSKK